MDHSLQEYFSRLHTKSLQYLLDRYLATKEDTRKNWDAIILILRELQKREKNEESEITPQIQAAWAKYQQRLAELVEKE